VLSSDVRLPVRDILNANPAWVRSKDTLLPLDELKSSLANLGMVLPVLLRNDFVVLDGARRVLAAEKLHWREVPVIVAHSWDTVLNYYAKANKLEAEGFVRRPLRWSELNELWSTLLKPVHETRRARQSADERARRSSLRQQGIAEAEVLKDNAYTGYVVDLAEMFQVKPIHVKLVRDIFYVYNSRLKVKHAEALKPFWTLVTEAEGMGVQTASTIRNFTRHIVAYGVSLDEAIDRATKSLRNAHIAPWRLSNRQAQLRKNEERKNETRPVIVSREFSAEEVSPPATVSVLRNLATLLEQSSLQAAHFHTFVGIDPGAIPEISATIRNSINRINAMRRRLEAHGKTLQQGESEQ
jgi:hypothetical protein